MAGALPMASAIILLPFYVTLLPTETYGALSLYMAFSLFIQVVVSYSFDSSIYIHYHEFKNDKAKLSSFITSAFIFMLLISLGVGLVLVVTGDLVFGLVFSDDRISFYPYGLMAIAMGVFQALFKIYSNLLQTSQRPVIFFWSNLLLFSLIAGLTIGGLYMFPGTLAGPIGGRAIAGLVMSVWVLVKIAYEYGVKFDLKLLKSTFSFNHYSFIYQLENWAVNYLDRFIMVFFLPLSDVGIYDFAVKCLIVIEYVMNGLYNSFYPNVLNLVMTAETKQSTPQINRYYHGLTVMVMILVCVLLPLLSVIIDSGFIRSGYEASIQFLPFIACVYLFRSMRYYFAFPYGALKYSKPLPFIYLGVSVIKFVILLLLIQRFEIYGVIAATYAGLVLEIFMLKRSVQTKFYFKYNPFKLIVAPVLLAAIILVSSVLVEGSYLLNVLYGVIAIVMLWWFYRNEIIDLKLASVLNKMK
jgi:O-antigen/teichoic acid export membrane protein